MRNKLFIWLAPGTTDRASWLRLAGSGQPLGGVEHGTLEQAAAHASGLQIIVLVPGSDVLLTQAAVPSQNRQRIARALPFVLEEQLAADVEELHFAIGQREAGQVSAAVVARSQMDTWSAALRAAGIQADWVVPDILALPRRPDSWTILAYSAPATWAVNSSSSPATALVRSAAQQGFAADLENLDILLESALAAHSEAAPKALYLIDYTQAKVSLTDNLSRAAELEIIPEVNHDEPLVLLAKNFTEQEAINLLQGDYSRREQVGKLWRPWRPAAALLMVWLLLQGGMMVAEINRLSSESQALRKQIERIYLQTFPEARKVVNPRLQMQRQLDALRAGRGGGGQGFLELLTQAGSPLKDTPNLNLRNVTYKEGQLNLELEISDLQALDQLKRRLTSQAPLDVEIQSATSQENKVQSRLQIQPKKS